MTRRNAAVGCQRSAFSQRQLAGFTLVEMLIAMAITLVMVGAVVTLFANISNSVRNRRAVVEMSGQLRHARNMLQQDLQGATCPGLPWQRPDENLGYIEIIEGPQSDRDPSAMLRDENGNDGIVDTADFDVSLSILPRNNAVRDLNGNDKIEATEIEAHNSSPESLSPGGLGDHDDILMLTVRNEHEPFVGRVPRTDSTPSAVRPNASTARGFAEWEHTTLESPLAEVVWYAVENPSEDENGNGFFGEPGMRTIYRRTLLIAPWLNPYRFAHPVSGNTDDTFQIDGSGPIFTAQPGLLRILSPMVKIDDTDQAIAALIAFQDRYDISARLEFDPLLDPTEGGRWKIVANTLGDLAKRENRYEHHQFNRASSGRSYPYAAASTGSGYNVGSPLDVQFVYDREKPPLPTIQPEATARARDIGGLNGVVVAYSTNSATNLNNPASAVQSRPFVYIDEVSTTVATPRAMLNDNGGVVRITHSLVPLWGDRRGEDVMLTDALGFDLRVYDPGAPLYGMRENPSTANSPMATILSPTDPAWRAAYLADVPDKDGVIGDAIPTPMVGQGGYVDMGYGFGLPIPWNYFGSASTNSAPWFFAGPQEVESARARYASDPQTANVRNRGTVSDIYERSRARAGNGQDTGSQLAPGYAVYDTWSFHYENNGINEDQYRLNGTAWAPVDTFVDEGTNGLDDVGSYTDSYVASNVIPLNPRLGPDDVGERETAPPYDKPLRGLQVLLRLYERDSRQVRQVSVNQHLVPE